MRIKKKKDGYTCIRKKHKSCSKAITAVLSTSVSLSKFYLNSLSFGGHVCKIGVIIGVVMTKGDSVCESDLQIKEITIASWILKIKREFQLQSAIIVP